MIKTLKKQLLYTTIILTAAYLLQWYFLYYYFTQLPEYVPHTNIKINGAIILFTLIVTFYFFQKKSVEKIPNITLTQLTGLGAIICCSAEIIFQAIRHIVEPDSIIDKFLGFLHSTITSSIISIVIFFIEALQIMHPRSIWSKIVPAIVLLSIIILKKATII